MNLKADCTEIVKAAAGWDGGTGTSGDGVAGELIRARNLLAHGEDCGSAFGAIADAAGVGEKHDRFVTSMVKALTDGELIQSRIADILRGIARDFGTTDTHVADVFHNKDGTPRGVK